MKRLLGLAVVLIFSARIFSATLKDAQDRLTAIEEFKSGILSSSPNGFFSDEEMVLDEILSVDPENMTPLQALELVARWKKSLSGR